MIITMDGPAGVGKSTAARLLAATCGIAYLDTGATYRAATLKALRSDVDMIDQAALAAIAREADIELLPRGHGLQVLLDGEDVSADIRLPEVSNNSHYLAAAPAVRKVLVDLQRKIGARFGDFVAEGRDQGSVVFPEADIKFYFIASAEVRAARRCAELAAAGAPVELDQVLADIHQRDQRDRGRPVAPLVRPEGAIEIDTTGMTIEQVQAELLVHVEARPCP